MKVRICGVDMIECCVDVDEKEFDDYDEMFDYVITVYGKEDVLGVDVKEDKYGDDCFVIEDDVSFVQIEVID